MRALVWTCRLILTVVILAFVVTIYYMTRTSDLGGHLDPAMPALNLVTVIGASLAGLLLPVARRYWQSLWLLLALVAMRLLFGGTSPRLSGLETELLTDWQSDFLWIAIGVTGLSLIVTITWRAIAGEKAVKAIKVAASTVPAQPVTAVAAPVEAAKEAAPQEEAPKKKTDDTPAVAEETKAEDKPKAEG